MKVTQLDSIEIHKHSNDLREVFVASTDDCLGEIRTHRSPFPSGFRFSFHPARGLDGGQDCSMNEEWLRDISLAMRKIEGVVTTAATMIRTGSSVAEVIEEMGVSRELAEEIDAHVQADSADVAAAIREMRRVTA
jgi:hypothetical protein